MSQLWLYHAFLPLLRDHLYSKTTFFGPNIFLAIHCTCSFIISGTLLKGEFSHPTDVLYNRACTITRLMLSPVTTVIKNVINESLNHWNEDFIGLLLEDRDILSLRIATVPDMVETFLTFADYLFLGLLYDNNLLLVSGFHRLTLGGIYLYVNEMQGFGASLLPTVKNFSMIFLNFLGES